MFQELLQHVGLTLNESRVYVALLNLGETNVNALAVRSKVHRRNVYDSLSKLIDRGLAAESFVKGEKRFRPTAPERLSEILAEKQAALQTQLPQMHKLYASAQPGAEAYFFRGTEGFKSYLQLILEQRQPVYFIGAKAFWLDPRFKHFLPRFERERRARGIRFKHLFDHEVRTQTPEILKLAGKPYKFLPPKYSTRTAVDIFGDYVVTFVGVKPGTLDEEPLQFVLKSRALADGYRTFFQFMWDFTPDN